MWSHVFLEHSVCYLATLLNTLKHKILHTCHFTLYMLLAFLYTRLKFSVFLALILSDKHSRSQKFYMTLQLLEYIIPLYAIIL